MIETSRRFVLRYNPGQFSFRNFDHTATDEQLYNLAHQLNAFQEDELVQVVRIRTLQF